GLLRFAVELSAEVQERRAPQLGDADLNVGIAGITNVGHAPQPGIALLAFHGLLLRVSLLTRPPVPAAPGTRRPPRPLVLHHARSPRAPRGAGEPARRRHFGPRCAGS